MVIYVYIYPALNDWYSFHSIIFVMQFCFINTEEVFYDLRLGILVNGFLGHSKSQLHTYKVKEEDKKDLIR